MLSGTYVRINNHDFIDGDVLISELSSKDIKILNISACNTGHVDLTQNVDRSFTTNNNVNEVIAWDGSAGYSFFWKKGVPGEGRGTFDKYASYKTNWRFGKGWVWEQRDPLGEVRYMKDSNGNIIMKTMNGRIIYFTAGGEIKFK